MKIYIVAGKEYKTIREAMEAAKARPCHYELPIYEAEKNIQVNKYTIKPNATIHQNPETMKKVKEVELKYHPEIISDTPVRSPEDANNFLRGIWPDNIYLKESFVVLLLNPAKKLIGYNILSTGGSTATIVDPVEITRLAILTAAHSVILAHNHPSGNMRASRADIGITKKINQGLSYFDIRIDDHIIINPFDEFDFLSMRINGQIE